MKTLLCKLALSALALVAITAMPGQGMAILVDIWGDAK